MLPFIKHMKWLSPLISPETQPSSFFPFIAKHVQSSLVQRFELPAMLAKAGALRGHCASGSLTQAVPRLRPPWFLSKLSSPLPSSATNTLLNSLTLCSPSFSPDLPPKSQEFECPTHSVQAFLGFLSCPQQSGPPFPPRATQGPNSLHFSYYLCPDVLHCMEPSAPYRAPVPSCPLDGVFTGTS